VLLAAEYSVTHVVTCVKLATRPLGITLVMPLESSSVAPARPGRAPTISRSRIRTVSGTIDAPVLLGKGALTHAMTDTADLKVVHTTRRCAVPPGHSKPVRARPYSAARL
jgi:hypothetical protein